MRVRNKVMPTGVLHPELEKKRRRLVRPSPWFWLAAAVLIVPGILLVVLATGALSVLGWVLIALGLTPLAVAGALTIAGGVGWWAARSKPFA